MTKVVQCEVETCKKFYDSEKFSSCPHCAEASSKKNKIPIWDKFLKKNKTGEEEVKPENKNVIPVTQPYEPPVSEVGDDTSGEQKEIQSSAISLEHKTKKGEPINEKKAEGSLKPSADLFKKNIARNGRTVGKYISGTGGEGSEPVMGWLVCVKGVYFGQSFNLKSGKNKIGRSHEMDIKLLNDETISRKCVASLIFDTKNRVFSLIPGESDSLCYVNSEALYERIILNGYEEIEFGDADKNKFVFIPLCSDRFDWSLYEKK